MPFPLLGRAISAGKEKTEATSETSEDWLVFLQKPAIFPSSCLLFPRKNRNVFAWTLFSPPPGCIPLGVCHPRQSCVCSTTTPLCLLLGPPALVTPQSSAWGHQTDPQAPHPSVSLLPVTPVGTAQHTAAGEMQRGPWAPPLSSATSSRLCPGHAVPPTCGLVVSRVMPIATSGSLWSFLG